jgi:diaminohydroxyphosphoribosylaminopyrimidine deaminase/5-amino-6-(5-phosphoribosylamino)uracil reductase|tara:strand:- start:1048 stop:2109 length:1062 start_codon:yes stop_codon:yes gene_type:complete
MKLAYNQARKILGNTGDNPAVGCVVVKNNKLISLAHTNFNGRPHAERIALLKKKIKFNGSLLYSTFEPCSHYGKTPPCIDIIKKQKIKSVYFSKFDPDERSFRKAKKKLNKYNIKTFENVNVSTGDTFYKDFYIRKKTNNIFISSKLATSKDLFISGNYNKWITNVYSRARVHLLRANHDSILTTSKTILKDNSMLNCRIDGLQKYSPKRFVIDKNLTIPMSSNIITTANKIATYVFYNSTDNIKLKKIKRYKVKTIKINLKDNHLDFNEIITFLRSNGYYRVFVEAGIVFNNFLLDNNYINDFYHFYSNQSFGNKGTRNTKSFFKKMYKIKQSKKEIKVNLLQDKLIKYSLK